LAFRKAKCELSLPAVPVSQFPAFERLFARHKLGPVERVEALTGGRLNSVARINDTFVLRWREPTRSTGSLKREAALLERLNGRVRTPECLASGIDEHLGEYLVQRWIDGQNLLEAWLTNPDATTREWWMLQWIESIKAIHSERFPRPGELPEGRLKEYPSWRNYMESRIRKRMDQLMRVSGIDRQLVLAAERYVRREAPVLEDGPFCLIHRDLHFANVLVDGPHLAAVLDFELAESGPIDYELDTIFRFLRYPDQFAQSRVAHRVTPQRFASVWFRLKRGYPEMFVPRLRERLALYSLDRDLSSLAQLYAGRGIHSMSGTEAAIDATLRRIGEILQHRSGPE
jgi:aminoglycoside phosphotransferase (APT) family kinase protein